MYKDATLFFSQDNAVTIANVVPTMDRIDQMLNDSAATPLHPAVKHALAFGRKLMNKYYSKTDLSNVYRIAIGLQLFWPSDCKLSLIILLTVLHPQLKLKYFQQHGWTKEWIETAEEIVREEFKKYMTATAPVSQSVCLFFG